MHQRTPVILALLAFVIQSCSTDDSQQNKRPNILFAISDDQSFLHTSFAGCKTVETPAFDRVAREGIFFTNCFAGSPGCAPSRSTLVTGRYHWQNEQSGQHASSWMKKYVPFVDLLERDGYHIGFTGKGVAPFKYAENDSNRLWRKENAAGHEFNRIQYNDDNDERTASGEHKINYFANFQDFLNNRSSDEPFFFWYGGHEPHRPLEFDSWKRTNKRLEDVVVPEFMPAVDSIKADMLNYFVEIEWFDLHLQRMLEYLEEIGELENTIVIVTSDNGMSFPRAKANGYEYGIHVPLAMRFPKAFGEGRTVDDLISFVDFAPTFLELTGTSTERMLPISGKSLKDILTSKNQGIVDDSREYVFTGRERHSSSRYQNWGYPQRTIRNQEYLLIWNIKPDRWPAGAPQRINPEGGLYPMYGIDENGKHHSEWAFTDIDECPSKSYIIENHKQDSIKPYFEWAVAKRPEYELFNVKEDPACLYNLAESDAYQEIFLKLKERLNLELAKSGDPRVVGQDKEIFDSYKRYSPIRDFPKPK